MTDSISTQGQAVADSPGTTVAAPDGASGDSVAQVQTSVSPGTASEESFFDPASIQNNPELMAVYKQMQGAFTKRMTAIKANQAKLDAYTQFEQDPQGTLRRVAAQYGVQIVPQSQDAPQDFNPQSWDEVKQHFFNEFKKEMNPVFNEVKQLKKQNIEARLDNQYPDWRAYEDKMMENLKTHPSLVNDPDMLYRMSVPQDVIEQRATKAAMQKLKATTETAQVSGTTNGKQVTSEPTGPITFQQAAANALRTIAARGIRRPA